MVAQLTNQHLAAAQVEASVDHRSLRAQSEDALARGEVAMAALLSREPTRHVGKSASAMARKGFESERADANSAVEEANSARFDALLAELERQGKALPITAGHCAAQAQRERRRSQDLIILSSRPGGGEMRGVTGLRGLRISELVIPPRGTGPSAEDLLEEARRLWADRVLDPVRAALTRTRQLLKASCSELLSQGDAKPLKAQLRELVKRLRALRRWAGEWSRRVLTERRAARLLNRAELSLEDFIENHPRPGGDLARDWAKRRGRRLSAIEQRLAALHEARKAMSSDAEATCEAELEQAKVRVEEWSHQMLEAHIRVAARELNVSCGGTPATSGPSSRRPRLH